MKPTKASSDKVHPLRPAARVIEPLEGWKLNSDFGFMRTPEGFLLVRLAEVLRWLKESQSVHRPAALSLLREKMRPDVMQSLYLVRDGDPDPVQPDHMWGFKTAAQIEDKKAQDRQNAIQRGLEHERQQNRRGLIGSFMNVGKISALPSEPTEPGLPALLKLIGRWWTQPKLRHASTYDILDDPKAVPLVNLSIRVDKAFELWGYGRAVDEALKAVSDDFEWTGAQLKAQQAVFKADGKGKFTQRLAAMSGLTNRVITRKIKTFNDAAKPVSSVFDMGRKRGKK